MSNGNKSAFPTNDLASAINGAPPLLLAGLTKRELACIELRIPETGDKELDAIIRKAQRRDSAAMAMQGVLSSGENLNGAHTPDNVAFFARICADALLAELAKEPQS